MSVLFRTDAALHIGTGHVMRCLTLANALRARGAECLFVCREFQGHLRDEIKKQGHGCLLLPEQDAPVDTMPNEQSVPPHAAWLGVGWEEDAIQAISALGDCQFEWLIVDHYALDARWELVMQPYANKTLVIDDLADRQHACDVLLDQTLGRDPDDYRAWVPANTKLLCGSQYALLRPEFLQWRDYSLARRQPPVLRRVLVNMGGVDAGNMTGQVLSALMSYTQPSTLEVTIILGLAAPHHEAVMALAQNAPFAVNMLGHVGNMAELMANSDLAIGAAGTTSWERCCLGLPALMFVLALNQLQVARVLQVANAAWCMDDPSWLCDALHEFRADPEKLEKMSQCASDLVSGVGVNSLLAVMGLPNA